MKQLISIFNINLQRITLICYINCQNTLYICKFTPLLHFCNHVIRHEVSIHTWSAWYTCGWTELFKHLFKIYLHSLVYDICHFHNIDIYKSNFHDRLYSSYLVREDTNVNKDTGHRALVSSDQATFFQFSIVQFWWTCANCSLRFLFLADRSGTRCGLWLL